MSCRTLYLIEVYIIQYRHSETMETILFFNQKIYGLSLREVKLLEFLQDFGICKRRKFLYAQ